MEGLYACTGIPVMGLAIGDLVSLIIEYNKKIRFENLISQSFHRSDNYADILSTNTVHLNKKQFQKQQLTMSESISQEAITRNDTTIMNDDIEAQNTVVSPLQTHTNSFTSSINISRRHSTSHIQSNDDEHDVELTEYPSTRPILPLEYASSKTHSYRSISNPNEASNPSSLLLLQKLFVSNSSSAMSDNSKSEKSIKRLDQTCLSTTTANTNIAIDKLSQSEFVLVELVRLNVVDKSVVKALLDRYDQS